ncbi:MAG: aminotransferase class I/II-fold pyridoxal phosphate-dependent enzyme [Lachnospiraceae bacterium]|nr:aminotransferase class I/II-fold pyridoxal phosphate-dependent enzyme [Lachnospiraceae bacterium]
MTFDFDKEINRLNTSSYKWDLYGDKYIPLWVADTDFEVPPAVTDRLQKLVDKKVYGYLLTGNGIYDAITDWFKREYDAEIEGKPWIKIIPGIVPALAVASNLGLEEIEPAKVDGKWQQQTESVTAVPNYSALIEAPETAGNIMKQVQMKCEMKADESGYEYEYYSLDFDALQEAVTDKTKVLYLCNPNNPVGRVYSYDELKQVSEFAKKNNLIVVSDEAHCEVVYEGKHIPFFTVDEYAHENSISLYSNGKLCNLPDLIMAFAVIPNAELRDRFEKLSYAFGEEHVMNVEAGIASYAESDEWKRQMVAYLKANRDYLDSELKKRFPKDKYPEFKMTHLEGTYLLWLDFGNLNSEWFMDNAGVFMSDGSFFGGAGHVRLNFATRRELLTEALDKIEEAVKKQIKI